jgi:hypothetical protein
MRWLLFVSAALFVTSVHGQAIVVSPCGSVNYTAAIGQLHQLTMNTSGYLCVTTAATRIGGVGEALPAALEAPPGVLQPRTPPEPPKPPTALPEPKK